MILVDTSVLISFFKGRKNSKVIKFVDIINRNIPYGINNIIYQEILQGARTKKEFSILKDYLSTQRFYDLLYEYKSYESAALLNINCRKNGITIKSSIYLIIAQTAIENNLYLLHDDKDFTRISYIEKKLKEY